VNYRVKFVLSPWATWWWRPDILRSLVFTQYRHVMETYGRTNGRTDGRILYSKIALHTLMRDKNTVTTAGMRRTCVGLQQQVTPVHLSVSYWGVEVQPAFLRWWIWIFRLASHHSWLPILYQYSYYDLQHHKNTRITVSWSL